MNTLPAHPIGSLRRYRGAHDAHVHPYAQVLFGVDGCLELEVAGRGARVDASAGLVVPPGAVHGFRAARAARVWVIDCPPRAGLDRVRGFALPPGFSPRPDADALLALAAAAPRVLARRGLDPARLVCALDRTLHEDWPNARMAALYALSVARFHARWLALTGQSPQAWLRAHRLDVAARALRAGRSLDAAAQQVGYRSASALAFALRRERGVGARDLRAH